MEYGDSAFVIARSRLPFGNPLVLRLWEVELVTLHSADSVHTALSIADHLPDPIERYGGTGEYMPYPLWARCDDSTIAIYDPARHVVRRMSLAGEEMAPHTLPPAKRIEL